VKKLLVLLAFLFWPAAALAAPAVDGFSAVQSHSGNSALALTLTTTNTNDIIVVPVLLNGGHVTSITSTTGLTFTLRKTSNTSPNSGTFTIEEWTAPAAAALTSETITVNVSSDTGFVRGGAFGVSGATFASPIDPGTSSGPTTPGTTAITLGKTYLPNDLIIGFYRFASTSTPTAGSGWTSIFPTTSTFMLIETQAFSSTQSSLSVAIGTGASDVSGGLVDAFTSDTDTSERSSKINSYPILNAGTVSAMSASKIDAYPILNAGTASAISVSKINTYAILKAVPNHTTPLFHSFPP